MKWKIMVWYKNIHIFPFNFSMGPPINILETKEKEENENVPLVQFGSYLKALWPLHKAYSKPSPKQ